MSYFSSDIQAAQVLWNYMKLDQPVFKADAIIVPGSWDTECAIHAAELYYQGLAPVIVMSGGVPQDWQRAEWQGMTEAEVFAALAQENGVPENALLIENRATNTSENLWFSEALLRENGYAVDRVIIVQKPTMERRLWATVKNRWPDKEFCVTSHPMLLDDYIDKFGKDLVIAYLVGDIQRIETYRGIHLVDQDIPAPIWPAMDYLTGRGYTGKLMEPAEETFKKVGYRSSERGADAKTLF